MDKDQKERVDQALLLFRGKSTESVNDFVTQLFMQHPTHQASVIRSLIDIVKEYENARFVDGRNEGAVRASKLINKLDKDENLYIPFI